MPGKLFVIDGTDGSGKNTQAKCLLENLMLNYNLEDRKDICMVSFPRYGTAGCTMVEKYLHGEFGKNVKDIDPYTASMFYSIDRSISFLNDEFNNLELTTEEYIYSYKILAKTNVKETVKDKESKESSEVAKDLAEMKETLKKIEQLIALLVDILPYKR